MGTKTPSEELKSFKQYNKVAREVRAQKLGFSSAAAYITHLEGLISGKPTPPPGKTSSKSTKATTGTGKSSSKSGRPTIHVVDILDSSGSMSGEKHKAALKGINHGIDELKKDKEPVNYTYTLCDFSDSSIFHHVKSKLEDVKTMKWNTRGSTSLFDAIGDSVAHVSPSTIKEGDKVLVNIYTDGQENSSRRFNSQRISELIEDLSVKGWTFTFIGTQSDVAYATSNLKVKVSNSLVYDGTGAGLDKALMTNTAARSAYSSKVATGQCVQDGFYKDID